MKTKKKRGKVPPHLRKYLFKKGHGRKKKKARKKSEHSHMHKEHSVAKRKKRKSSGGRRRGGSGRRRSHRRHHHGGGITGGGWKTDLVLAGGGLALGMVEKKMKEDATFFLNKLPTPIAAIGRTGNLTLAAYLASYVAPVPPQWKRHIRTAARVGAVVTMYQLGRKGEAFKEGAEVFTISGFEDADEHGLGDDELGSVADEMDELSGRHATGTLSFDAHLDEDDPVHADVAAEVDAHTSQ